METRPCGQLAPPGSAPRPGPGVAETPRRGASHARSRKKALVLVSTRRPSACSRGPPGGSAADQPDQEPRADAGSTPGGAPITPLRGAAPGSRGGRRPWALPGTSVELHSALPVGAWSRSTPHPTQCTQLSPGATLTRLSSHGRS
ncbi:putative uncharacterized protein BRD3OS isoform X2 [Eptesicus fuscus]|uniref:putative uncharacterized protein BRD3OS isoform X2 n=1 Tax=Eptesicus fuscus TaxID=29078 RepID=UPI002403CD00|nr:putative uncharacterized protein BRD3OS isoform X2 [Eptesicus fuscus]